MSQDKLIFLGGDQPSGGEPTSASGPPSVPVAPDDGGLASNQAVAPAPAALSDPATTPAAPRPREDGHVPISALLDEREKRQVEKATREALERQIAEMRAQAQPQRELEPTEALEVALYAQNLRASRRFAEREYGKDTIASVHDWAARRCDEDPHFNQQMSSSDDPYEAAYQAYNREQILRTVKHGDLAAFKAWQSAQPAAGQPTPSAASPAPVPPRSLATASGTGGAGAPHVPVGPGQAFMSAIPR